MILKILNLHFKNSFFKHLFFFLFLFLINQQVSSQYNLKDIKAADKLNLFTEKKVDSILNSFQKKDSLYAQIAHNFSLFFKKKRNYDLAIKYGIIELDVLDDLNLINRNHTNALYNLGNFHNYTKQYDKAIKYFKRAIISNAFPLKVGQSYCRLGQSYYRKGDFYKSMNYYLKGFPLMEKHSTKKGILIQYIRLSYNCNKMNSEEGTRIGLLYLKKADSIIKNTPNYKVANNILFPLYNSFANLYSLKHQYNFNKAKYYYKYNLKNALINNDTITIANTYLNIGELYLNKKNDSALYFLKKSLEYDSSLKYDFNETYRNIADYYKEKKLFDKGLANINNSLKYNFNVKNIKDISNLSIEQNINTKDKRSTIQALKTKTEILLELYNTSNNKTFLNEAIKTVRLTNKVTTILVNYNTESETKFLWREEVSKIFDLGINAAFLLNRPSIMFEFMEKNKAFLLATEVNSNLKNLKLPLKITSRDLAFKKNILKLENNKINNQTKDSLFNLKEKYTFFKDSVSKLYPHYKTSKNRELLSLNKVIEQLSDNEVIISYALDYLNYGKEKTTLFGLLISKKKNIPFKIKNVPQILNLLNNYKTLISKPLTTKNELYSFNKVAYSLYELLFPSDEIREYLQNNNITIIPDTYLENIPFEALNTNKNGLNYLIEKCNISYSYSFSFSKFNSTIKRKTTNDFAGFAPIEFKNSKKTPLKHSKQEILNINELINGKIYTNSNANKDNFLKQSSKSKIIHLATHANSEGNPSIDFYDKKLELHELYTYKNNADLVVLSACETNLGEIKKGEGVLSLARGFFYSGANTVVSSLWNANDTSTSFLMKEFYTNLKNKQSKIEALNNAKRTYLKSHSLSEKSPYYWASFVLIGDTTETFNNHHFYYIIPIILVLLLILFFFKKRGNKFKNDEQY